MYKKQNLDMTRYCGLSTDDKPNASFGSCYHEMDTGDVYRYDGETWHKSGTISAATSAYLSMFAKGNTRKLWGLMALASGHDTGVLKTVTGNPISISDAIATRAKALTVDMSPIQDLHGYDNPWPAGGGKNKIPFPYTMGSEITVNGVTATVSSDGTVTLNGTATAQAEFPLIATYMDLPAGTYTLSGLPSGGSATTFLYNAYAFDENGTKLFDYRIPFSRTVTANNPIKRMYIYIRVAEGYTANNLIVKPQFEEGSTATAYAPYSNICPISGRESVTVWREATYDTSAEPAFTVQLGQTVYGGTIDMTAGTVTVDRAMIALDTLKWSQNGSNTKSFEIATVNWQERKPGQNNFICNALPFALFSDTETYSIRGYTSSVGIAVHLPISVASSVKDAVQWLTDNGVQLCYELAEPQTITLTPQSLALLKGSNTLWTDGDALTLTYKAN